MKKDWVGNKKTTFSILGASNHSEHERALDDYYATNPSVLTPLLDNEDLLLNIWENACGAGHLSKKLEKVNFKVKSSDKVNRGYGEIFDFLKEPVQEWDGDILTNPPYKYAQEWVEKSMKTLHDKNKLCLFLKLLFLEGQKRKEMFKKYPPQTVYVFSARQKCVLNGDFENSDSSAVCYAWFVWEKGYTGETVLKWV